RDRMDARPEENRAPWMAWRDCMDARPEENRAPWMAWRDCMDARLIIVASTNPGKIREVRLALGDLQGWAVEPLPPGIHGIEETGGSFIENAIQKAEHYSRFVEGLTLGDDSGLCVHALHDAPGLHSAR